MKGLLIKDFRLLGAQKSYYIVLACLSAGVAYFSGNVAMIFTFIGTVFPLFALSSISYDQFDNGNPFLFSLPITRREYVLEKYVFTLSLEGIALLFSTALALIISRAINGGADLAMALSALVVALPLFAALILLVMSVMIPVNLKYGAEKGRVALVIVIGALVALVLLIEQLIKMVGGTPIGIASLLDKLAALGMGPIILAVLVLAAAVCGVSVTVSMQIIKKKEY